LERLEIMGDYGYFSISVMVFLYVCHSEDVKITFIFFLHLF